MTQPVVYCIDTSALIDIGVYYPEDIFPVWHRLEGLIKEGRLIAPYEVFKEIRGDEWLSSWVKANRTMFVTLNEKQLQIVEEIYTHEQFRGLVDPSKDTPDADPFIIALAVARKEDAAAHLFGAQYIVVTSEKHSGNSLKPKIPDVCDHYGIECLNGSSALTSFFRKEGWTFR